MNELAKELANFNSNMVATMTRPSPRMVIANINSMSENPPGAVERIAPTAAPGR